MNDIKKARMFCNEVRELAKKYELPFFVVTNGASSINNNGCEAVRNARMCHEGWEKANGLDHHEDWSR